MSIHNKRNSVDHHFNDLFMELSVPGLSLTTFLLLGFAYTAWNRTSRSYLNRVSFRLLVYAMISNIIVAAVSIPVLTAPSPGCASIAFAANCALLFSSSMFFCMALNLLLVVIYGVNGRMMEKYYLIGSFVLSGVPSVTALAAGQFGYYSPNNTIGSCWFTNPDPMVQLRWVVGTQSIWIISMASFEVVAFIILVCFMMRPQQLAPCTPSKISDLSLEPAVPTAPILQYRAVVLRVGLYPLLSCVLNFPPCIVDLHLIINPVDTELNRSLNFLDLCIYSLRTLLYACLAATDPSFLRAVHSLRTTTTQEPSGLELTSLAELGEQTVLHGELERVANENATERKPSLETGDASIETRDVKITADPEQGVQQGGREDVQRSRFWRKIRDREGARRVGNMSHGIESQI
ncbi:hypothetical protein DFH07DRAFT_853174 [Mycena maculata]|uniref:G-protein coupled receptors family 2 profile 2 domain-containing protein n=1 Tax=Mycena maculata TaxID=230809 RepID=A0AAD7HQR9_9AGAR|nr:hypothetical protein DFH07DRAFT_853174 [Mycena maculata]